MKGLLSILYHYCRANSSTSTDSYCQWTSCLRKRFNILADSEICSLTAEKRYIPLEDLRPLNHKIEFISGLVQSLRARRNAISPISILPPEVLILIFKAYIDDDINALGDRDGNTLAKLSESCGSCGRGYSSTYLEELPKHLGWIECSRVCQRWRHIIFEISSLWSDVLVDLGPLWLPRFIRYSQSASKIRFLGYYSRPGIPGSKQVWSNPSASDLSRADRISLGAKFQSTLTSLLRGFRFKSTILKTIELTVTTTYWEDSQYPISADKGVPLGLLLHNFPLLERISLRGCLVDWKPPPLRSHSLKFMEVNMDDRYMEGRSSAKFLNATDASDFLRSTPLLEILTLVYCFPCRFHQDTRTDTIIELPCLRELDLGEWHDSRRRTSLVVSRFHPKPCRMSGFHFMAISAVPKAKTQ